MQKIMACHDGEGVWVYQAFRTSTVEAAVRKGTFGLGFNLDRMTWIKPSFGWMLHRSGYAAKHGQEAIARIRLSRGAFETILSRSVPTSYDPRIHASEFAWSSALRVSDVRHQWDPDRDLPGRKLDRRAIQIGMRGATVHSYVHDGWILAIEDATALARSVQQALQTGDFPEVPPETEYRVDAALARRLGIDAGEADP